MKDLNGGPPIAEAVSFLGKFAPNELIRLKAELPSDIHPLLVEGGLAGVVPATLRSRAQVQLAALKQIKDRITRRIRTAELRLKLAKRIRLLGDIAAVLGSSSVLAGSAVGSSSGNELHAPIYVGGIVALVGALSGVLSDYAIRLPDTGGSLFEVYSGLGEARFEAETLIAEIEILLSASVDEDIEAKLAEDVGAANALCRKMQKSFALILESAN